SREFFSGDAFEVLEKDLVLVRLGKLERFEDLQGHARKHRAALGIEWAIRREDNLIDGIEFQAALGRRYRAKRRRIRIEILLEIIDGPFLEAFAQRHVILVAGALPEDVPTGSDAAFQHGNDAAEMMDDDFEARVFVERL